MKGFTQYPSKCFKCGGKVCRGKARFYTAPLNQLCVSCRKKELDKTMEKKE